MAAFFNPQGYLNRVRNFRAFRRHLKLPLLVAELGFNGQFQLEEDDADQILRVTTGDVLWQKERLLNLAVQALPPCCDAVVTVDADVLFTNPDWPAATLAALGTHPIVQPHAFVTWLDRHTSASLEPGGDPRVAARWLEWAETTATRAGQVAPLMNEPWSRIMQVTKKDQDKTGVLWPSAAYAWAGFSGRPEIDGESGGAWAFRREFLERHPFYEALIGGGGDKLQFLTYAGLPERVVQGNRLGGGAEAHYRRWAEDVMPAVGSEIPHVPGVLAFMWHGLYSRRRYLKRHEELRKRGFDPGRDLRTDSPGGHEWTGTNPSVANYLKGYFASRFEDGHPADEAAEKGRLRPARIRLEATSRCQLCCPACPTANKAIQPTIGSGALSVDAFSRLLDEAPWLEAVELSNYGELFLHRDLLEILRVAAERGVALSASNGTNLNQASDEVLEGLVRYGFQAVSCSIDGTTQETYAQYRVGGDLETVLTNIRTLNGFKRKYRSELPRLRWQFIVFGHNEHQIPEARRMTEELGMEFFPKLNWDEDFSPIRDPERVRQQTELAATSRSEFRDQQGANYMDEICEQLWHEPQINWDGKLLGCCRNFWGDFGGNAFEDGLDTVLNGEDINYARRMLQGKAPPREGIPCTTCELYVDRKEAGRWVADQVG